MKSQLYFIIAIIDESTDQLIGMYKIDLTRPNKLFTTRVVASFSPTRVGPSLPNEGLHYTTRGGGGESYFEKNALNRGTQNSMKRQRFIKAAKKGIKSSHVARNG